MRRLISLVVIAAATAFPLSDATGASHIAATAAIVQSKGILWQDPKDIRARNLFYGPGGHQGQPKEPFTFLEEDHGGSNPKFDVRDADGKHWKVKLGVEARPETAAARLLWAVGFITNENYLLSEAKVSGMPPHLNRGTNLVEPGGTVRAA